MPNATDDTALDAATFTPRALTAAIADPDRAAAKRAFDAMMEMGRSTSLRSKRLGAVDASVAHAKQCIGSYLTFYNTRRPHS